MTEEELEKFTVDFMNNETGTNWSRIDSIMGKMLIKYAEVFQKRIEELEKENAELKDDNKVMADNYSKMEQKFYDNLAKAKEIIREFMKYEINEYDGSLEIHFEELKKQAEQFLSEVEK